MMGPTHVLSGALTMLTAAPLLGWAAPSIAPHGPIELAAATVACAGAALLPDLDHPSATIARAFGSVSHLLSRIVAWAARGHRQATHSIPFVLLAGGLAGLAGHAGGWWAWVPVTLLIGLAATALGLSRTPAAVAVTGALVAAGAVAGVEYGPWLGVAVALGSAAHLAGDCLTVQGCPLWWPRPRRYRMREWRTGGPAERRVAVGLVVAIAGVVVLFVVDAATGTAATPTTSTEVSR